MRSKMVLILALVMGIVTTVLFFNYMSQFDAEKVMNENMVEVVTAKERINNNEIITSAKLEMVMLPEKGVHPQTVKTFAEVEGKIATGTMEKGEPILAHRAVSEREESLYVSRKVKQGFRAVSVGVNFNQSVSNLIEPEDEVDIVYSKVVDEGQGKKVESVLLLEKVRVLAVGRKMVASVSNEEPYVEYSSVTLEVKLENAVTIINASEQGSLHFTLHKRPVEKEEENVENEG